MIGQQLQSNTLLQGGKYQILKVLGQGGFGITYLALQTGLERKVAVKEFFLKDYCDRESDCLSVKLGNSSSKEIVLHYLNKFKKEARTISTLDHPNIIRIMDVFSENNTAYYVMDYIDGMSLADTLRDSGPMSKDTATSCILQVADALRYLHDRRINHLDVKPGNIMLKQDGHATLIDFGGAKQYDESTIAIDKTSTLVCLSPGYAPIEQYDVSRTKNFAPTYDIYALAATYYKMLTNETPPNAFESTYNFQDKPLRSKNISKGRINCIRKAMLSKDIRTQTISEFVNGISRKSSGAMWKYAILLLCVMVFVGFAYWYLSVSDNNPDNETDNKVPEEVTVTTKIPFQFKGYVGRDKVEGKIEMENGNISGEYYYQKVIRRQGRTPDNCMYLSSKLSKEKHYQKFFLYLFVIT